MLNEKQTQIEFILSKMKQQIDFADEKSLARRNNAVKFLLCVFVLATVTSTQLYYSPVSNVFTSSCNLVPSVAMSGAKSSMQQLPDKIVLLWTPFFSEFNWESHIQGIGGPEIYLVPNSDNPFNRTCVLTRDRHLLVNASAVIFHGRNFDFNDLPKIRLPNQRWVFYLLESPYHSGFDEKAWRRASQLGFNWTMYYTFKSDSRFAYGNIQTANYNETQLEEINERITAFAANFTSRPFDGVCVVSNCGAPSRRNEIVMLMQQAGLKIEGWGGCFQQRPDDELKRVGPASFYSRYRFYLAMENSICDDYATEKCFNAASFSELFGTIPIVFGGANYSEILGPGSFVDLRQPNSSLHDVISLVKRLGQPGHFDEVRKYYEWLLNYTVDKRPFTRPSWQSFCEKLWDETAPMKTIDDIRRPLGECHENELSLP